MAPVKFEDNLKNTLEKRTIQPSQDAWNRLENRLDKNAGKSKKRFYIWGIAASVAGLLMAFMLFFNDKPTVANGIVDTHQELDNSVKTENASEVKNTHSPIQDEEFTKERSSKVVSGNTQLKDSESIKEVPGKADLSIQRYEDVKADEVIAQAKSIIEQHKAISESELDSLLLLAEQEIKAYKLLVSVENQKTTNPEMLLAEVETDIDNTFRNRVLKKLLSGYESVKEVVVTRKN